MPDTCRGGPCGGSEVWPGTRVGANCIRPTRHPAEMNDCTRVGAHITKGLRRCCMVVSHTVTGLRRCCMVVSHTATGLHRCCVILSHTATTLRRWCMILSHTATTLCRCCMVVSHTATRLCRCCVVVSHTATAPRRCCMILWHTAAGHAMGRMQYAPTRVHVGRMLLRPYMYPAKFADARRRLHLRAFHSKYSQR